MLLDAAGSPAATTRAGPQHPPLAGEAQQCTNDPLKAPRAKTAAKGACPKMGLPTIVCLAIAAAAANVTRTPKPKRREPQFFDLADGRPMAPTLDEPLFRRTAVHRACAAACVARGGSSIFLQHVRKAGGTMLRNYLAQC